MEGLQQIWPVAFVLVLLGAVLWLMRRGLPRVWARQGAVKSIESLERLTLTPQHTLHRVRAGGRELLVATHPHGCTVIEDRAISDIGPSCG